MKASRFWSRKQAKVKATIVDNADNKGWADWKSFNNEIEDIKTFLRARGSYVLNHRLLYECGKAIIIFYPGHARLQDLLSEMATAFPNVDIMFEEKEKTDKKFTKERNTNESGERNNIPEEADTEDFAVNRQES